ncbi:MAG TPA: VOC family protein, partial [Hyphomicrobiaceae bacterium]|nr:VOC family protein [Hyphomicrobiaceae bacterium]
MQLQSFGYFGIRSQKLDDWAEYGPKFLGLEVVERTPTTLKLRMDDRKQRILVSSTDADVTAFGFEVADAAALDALAARLEGQQVSVRRVPAADAALRGVTGAIRFSDPLGNSLEAFYGPEARTEPFKPGRPMSGFRTGVLGMGHAVLHVKRVETLVPFYRDVLGFKVSDFMVKPFKAYFFHLNPRQHSLALLETGRDGIHHIMMETGQLDDVGQALDLATVEGRLAVSLGRHTNDLMTSFYARTPDDFLIEYGWGGRLIEPESWEPSEMTYGGSLWGHDPVSASPELLAARRAAKARVVEAGLRQPVQVAEGNY